MSDKVCKKCSKPLPGGYKYKECESCRNIKAESTKNFFKAFAGAAATVITVVVAVAFKKDPK